MKTFKANHSVEIVESIKRIAFQIQLTFVCLFIPVIFLLSIKGNEHKNQTESGYEKIYTGSVNANSTVNFRAILSDKNS
ncbi:MAG: hypothetical protein J0H55_07920 [Chitinophagaceae bacterium]|nr:hypothetical protein [Chitinophagaceae bacterium]